MENQVEEIKRKLNIVNVIGSYIPLRKKGRHYTACCPFHGEKTPSFMVSEELQIYKCFGCSKAGDMFSFVEEYEKIDFKEALEELAKMAGVQLVKNTQATTAELQKKKLLEINNEVARFYHFMLISHPLGKSALEYVSNRGITKQSIEQFKIGFAPRDSQYISTYLIDKKKYHLHDLVATGTFGVNRYGKSGVYDRFSGRLTFPLLDYRDRVLGFSGRVLPGADTNQAKYINSPETDLYHKSHLLFGLNFAKDAIREQKYVIIVEGEFDMIAPFQHGVKNIVAIKGTAFTKEQLELLHRYTDTLILALDSDFAGSSAARRSIELADTMGFDIKVLSLGDKFKDPDEAIKADPAFFDQQLKKALPIWDFIIQSTVAGNDPTTIKGKKNILEIVLPFLAKITNAVIKDDYIRKLALEIGSTPESIKQEITHYTSPNTPKQISTATSPIPLATKKVNQLEYLCSLIFSAKNPHKVSQKLLKDTPDLFQDIPLIQKLIDLLLASSETVELFHQSLPAELKPTFESIYLKGLSYNFTSDQRRVEIVKVITTLKTMAIKDKLKVLSQKIALLENQDDVDLLSTTVLEYNKLLRLLSQVESSGP